MTLDEAIKHCYEKADCSECGQEHKQLAEWLEELQRYKDLDEQGRLIELPCDVGDTVYDIAGKEARKQIVDGIEYTADGFFIYANEDEWLGRLGDLVFLTREEAEAKLKELGDEHE